MDNMEGHSPNSETDDLPEIKKEKFDNAGSSNEETEDETEDGQRDREEVVAMNARKRAGSGRKQYNPEEQRIMNDISRLSPAILIAEIDHLEKQLYELSQREAREIVRTKQLDIFGKNKRRAGK